jgi:hypothetical protein
MKDEKEEVYTHVYIKLRKSCSIKEFLLVLYFELAQFRLHTCGHVTFSSTLSLERQHLKCMRRSTSMCSVSVAIWSKCDQDQTRIKGMNKLKVLNFNETMLCFVGKDLKTRHHHLRC